MNDLHAAAPTAAPGYLERTKTRVRVFTASGVLEGDYAHPPGVRLSDSLRNAATGERYMLLTDVTMRTGSDGIDEEAGTAPLVLLNTAHASVIIPLGE